jgi:hypothetical protein
VKICYVLTVDDDGVYADLAHLSLLSIKITNPTLAVEVVVDSESHDWLIANRHPLINGACLITRILSPYGRSLLGSRFIKTSLRQHVRGDFLFVDTDTVIVGNLGKLSETIEPFAAVHDRNFKRPYPHLPFDQSDIFQKLRWTFPSNAYFNSGVMLVRDVDEAYLLYEQWHSRWLMGVEHGLCTDQQSLNSVLAELPIKVKSLDWRYNASSDASPYSLIGAKIIHYYQSQKISGSVAEYFTILSRKARGVERADVDRQLRVLIAEPTVLWRLYEWHRFLIQIPNRLVHSIMMNIRNIVIAVCGFAARVVRRC